MGASFGSWLKQRRRAHGWSQAELAQQVGCSAALIRKIEGDERRPSRQIAELIVQRASIEGDDREALLRLARSHLSSTDDQGASSVVAPRFPPQLLSPLTERENEILKLILADLADSTIAERLSLKISTVRWYVKQIYSKLDVHNRDEVMEFAGGHGLPEVSDRDFIDLPAPINRAMARLANTLPQDIADRYVGRQQETTELTHLLRSHTRLVSVYGRSGMGKTALVCKVLTDLLKSEDTPDGVVSLGVTTTGISLSQILTGFARLLGGSAEKRLTNLAQDGESSPKQKVNVLLDLLRQGWYILLLDNLETLQKPSTGELFDPDLHILFHAALEQGGLCILITSQMQLALERTLMLSERRVHLRDGLSEDDAIALLRQFDPDGAVGLLDASKSALQQCVHLTHGYPRALEAVAGILLEDPLLPVEQLLDDATRLSHEMSAIVQQAITRLDPLALQVIQALSIFPRSVSQDAITWVLQSAIDTTTLRSILSHLVRGYFVRFNRADQQFSLHPLDRETAYRMIPLEDGELLARYTLHTRAADYFRQQRKPRHEWKQYEDVLPILDEFEQCVSIEDYDEAIRLLLMIDHDYLWEWGQYTLLKSLHGRLRGHIQDGFLNRQHLRRVGWLTWSDDTNGAEAIYQQVLTSAREARDRQSEADALDDLAQIARKRGTASDGLKYHQQALMLYREIGDIRGQAEALGGIGSALAFVDPDMAIPAFTEALEIHQEMENIPSLAFILNTLGVAHIQLGEYERAHMCLMQSLDLCQQHSLKTGQALALAGLAWIEQDFGNYGLVADYCHKVLEFGRETGNLFALSIGFHYLGSARYVLGERKQGEADLRLALEIAGKEQRYSEVMAVGATLARLFIRSGNISEAAAVLHEVEAYGNFFPPILAGRGLLYTCTGEDALAMTAFEQLLDQFKGFLRQGRSILWEQYSSALARTLLAFLKDGDLTSGLLEFKAALSRCSPAGLIREYVELLEILMKRPNGERLRPILDTLQLFLSSK